MADVQLLVNGNLYGGWQTVTITRGITQIAGNFELGVSQIWPDQTTPIAINEGDRCALQVDGETLITGWVDDVAIDYADRQHSVTVRGRDVTGDLVDCAAIHKSGGWKQQTLLKIAQDLCEPFGITVSAEVDVGAPFEAWTANNGESVFEQIDRMAKYLAVLPVSDGKGNLVLARAGKTRIGTALVLGQNIEASSCTRTGTDRFSEYIVKGQRPVSDDAQGEQATEIKGTAEDKNVKRYRPLIIIADEASDAAMLQQRAEWESHVRAGRATAITYTVSGWRHAAGLWHPNVLVPVRDPFLRVQTDMLISQVRNRLDKDGGTRTELHCVLPAAFDLLPIPAFSNEDFA